MPNPFDKERQLDFKAPKDIDDLVYAEDRYKIEHSPHFIYFPSKLLYFKLMRACLGITKVESLWCLQYIKKEYSISLKIWFKRNV